MKQLKHLYEGDTLPTYTPWLVPDKYHENWEAPGNDRLTLCDDGISEEFPDQSDKLEEARSIRFKVTPNKDGAYELSLDIADFYERSCLSRGNNFLDVRQRGGYHLTDIRFPDGVTIEQMSKYNLSLDGGNKFYVDIELITSQIDRS